MKRFFTKLGRVFLSRAFLKLVLWTLTLIIFFYVEEDWRGARAWAATKAKWEAKGESLDFARFIPAPIPDAENLAAIPLFHYEGVEYEPGQFEWSLPAEQKAVDPIQVPDHDIPAWGNWQRGELIDLGKLHSSIAADFAAAHKNEPPPADALSQMEALYPFLADLRAAAATRPSFRLNIDYTSSPPASRPMSAELLQIRLSKLLTLHAILALEAGKSDIALDDLKINTEVARGVNRDPALVSALIKVGMIAIANGAIYRGLALHQWNDAQLAEIQQTLAPINYLADFQAAYRNTAAESAANIDYYKIAGPTKFYELLEGMTKERVIHLPFAWPGGWWDQNKAKLAEASLQCLTMMDPKARRVFPAVTLELENQEKQAKARWDADAPWNIWYTIAAQAVANTSQQAARAQTWLDETRIACALERYRLANGKYPATLAELSPAYIDSLPHDVITGQDYRYQARGDGTFLLYSIGWDQKDDGGKIVYFKDAPTQINYWEGDWPWPIPAKNP